MAYIVVIGGANMDIGGRSDHPLIQKDSNPGRVTMSLGGVGRNIAHNSALLGLNVKLLTALGDDLNAQKIKDHCRQVQIDISSSIIIPDASTSTYLFINDHDGDMALALSDMNIYSYITSGSLSRQMELINGAGLVIIDTNIPAQSIEFLLDHCNVPVFADPVSRTKAERLLPVIGKLHTVCPNILEAEILSGVKINNPEDILLAASRLLESGLSQVFITRGSDGVYCANGNETFQQPTLTTNIVNATGAGDAFAASLAFSFLRGLSLQETALVGSAASAIALESTETINPLLSLDEIRKRVPVTF
ncbi:carbohydrate kinase family protein [Parasporobacterium paucivorans]|uniref:Pseudouridine kinase n=1 Tax=Parasporobacterium paucivorans DSM 15970 TaxID=1122934 RepID=A0A1M6L6V5_9FIRM|nr:carbohydrate kinase family protein [Parasporobacterium paucivorans]SHJ66978.1 pseudouridine kinase [Parasporobacterium paucivorans DSM 15970]